LGGILSLKKPTAQPLSHGDIPDWSYSAVQSILLSLKASDEGTFYHCLRVGSYSQKLAKAMGLSEFQQKIAEFSGMLHDVGKVGVESSIINKPTKLNPDEYKQMMSHPVLSEEIVKPLGYIPFFQQVLPAVRNHHERVDGKGYPDNLNGEEIPLLARVILIVDTLDAMSQDRAYRKGLSLDIVYKELDKFAGTQFDSSMVKIFLESHKFWSKDIDVETQTKILKKAA
jgi:HD-GYP domain-containing protein (c-di-GMP phosphodiesterase class II)